MRASHDPRLISSARAHGIDDTMRLQNGVILRAQALAAGVPRATVDGRIRCGRWKRVLPGVLTSRDPASPAVRMRAAWLWAGPDAVVGGRAALFWTGLIERFPTVIDLYVPLARSRAVPPGIRVHRATVDERDIRWVRTVAITRVARSCLDLARWRAANDYLDLALRRRFTTGSEIHGALARCKGCAGVTRAAEALRSVEAQPWSPPERMVHEALRAAGITGWVANHPTRTTTRTVHPDIGFEDVMLAVEIDGRRYHDEAVDEDAFERGHRRDQALVNAGWVIVHFSASQVFDDVHGVVATIVAALRRLRGSAA